MRNSESRVPTGDRVVAAEGMRAGEKVWTDHKTKSSMSVLNAQRI